MSVRKPSSLTTRLLLLQIVVSVAMALTMILVAVIAGPPLFEAHMRAAGHPSPEVLLHSEEAFNAAGALALLIGLSIAVTGSIAVSVLVSRRLHRSLTELDRAAARISAGDYGHRMQRADSSELAALADSFNAMAARLDAVESSRRRLLTDLAHEIRTPLATMEICVESIEDGVMDPGPQAWQILSSQIGRISRLADDLGQVSAAEEGRLELDLASLDVNELATGVVLAAREAFDRKQVGLAVATSPTTVFLLADRGRVEQVLSNLLSNALRHTSGGEEVRLAVEPDAAGISLRVSDTGDGIAAEHLPHIFERFYRTDTARDRDSGGTGVGLAISSAIARAHGGRLTASSDGPGRGATFTLWLPVHA